MLYYCGRKSILVNIFKMNIFFKQLYKISFIFSLYILRRPSAVEIILTSHCVTVLKVKLFYLFSLTCCLSGHRNNSEGHVRASQHPSQNRLPKSDASASRRQQLHLHRCQPDTKTASTATTTDTTSGTTKQSTSTKFNTSNKCYCNNTNNVSKRHNDRSGIDSGPTAQRWKTSFVECSPKNSTQGQERDDVVLFRVERSKVRRHQQQNSSAGRTDFQRTKARCSDSFVGDYTDKIDVELGNIGEKIKSEVDEITVKLNDLGLNSSLLPDDFEDYIESFTDTISPVKHH